MIFDKESRVLSLGISEFVTVSRRSLSPIPPCDNDEPTETRLSPAVLKIAKLGDYQLCDVSLDFEAEGLHFSLADKILYSSDAVTIVFKTERKPNKPSREELAEARGEGFTAAYLYAVCNNLHSIKLNIIFINVNERSRDLKAEEISEEKLHTFFEKCKKALPFAAKPEIDRVTKRLPTLDKLKFPYPAIREGQQEFMSAVYKSICREGRLYASAPTGTGKTISALYPALLALGRGKCNKVFYFTPKNTSALAAIECIELCVNKGALVRAISLGSKERLCESKLLCLEDRRLCKNSEHNKINDAVMALYNAEISVVTPNTVQDFAKKYSVCPHELSFSYSELCDVVIADINYLFSPDVYIRRFFTKGGKYTFLIDEAHNLPDRARDMYSSSISSDDILAPVTDGIVGELSSLAYGAKKLERLFFDTLYPYLKDDIRKNEEGALVGAAHISEVPTPLYDAVEELVVISEEELMLSYRAKKDGEKGKRIKQLKKYLYKLKGFLSDMYLFNSHYEMFIFFENEKISARLFCIDPEERIKEKLDKGSSAVFFSGTLSPIHYYKQTLGADASSETLELDSPFDKGQLSVSIMDKVSTRYSERADTMLAVSRIIAATVSARRGNYMIFTPSFAYAESLAKSFSARYPKIRTLVQRRNMSDEDKEKFLAEFSRNDKSYLIAFCVMGGIYSEGIDLAGEKLIGAVVVGIGLPALSFEREAIAAYYQEKYDEGREFAYIYPGINRVLQAAGRVIRREDDRGVIVLIDDRFDDPIYKKLIPKLWSGMNFVASAKELKIDIDKFWNKPSSS